MLCHFDERRLFVFRVDFITNLDFLFCASEMKSLKAREEHILDLEEQVISFHSFLSYQII